MAAESSSSSSSPMVTERRGIPAAAFVEDVQTYLNQLGLDVNSALAFLQERLQQYKLVEMKLLAQQRDLQINNGDGEMTYDMLIGVVNSMEKTAYLESRGTFNGATGRVTPAKIPDIEKCLDIVATLQARKGTGEALVVDFEVSEGIYSRARVEDSDSVCLWLGANVMLEYTCDEANALLQKNLENAKASLDVLVADLQFLRDQVTITQVTIARVYNWDVHQRRMRQTATASADS